MDHVKAGAGSHAELEEKKDETRCCISAHEQCPSIHLLYALLHTFAYSQYHGTSLASASPSAYASCHRHQLAA